MCAVLMVAQQYCGRRASCPIFPCRARSHVSKTERRRRKMLRLYMTRGPWRWWETCSIRSIMFASARIQCRMFVWYSFDDKKPSCGKCFVDLTPFLLNTKTYIYVAALYYSAKELLHFEKTYTFAENATHTKLVARDCTFREILIPIKRLVLADFWAKTRDWCGIWQSVQTFCLFAFVHSEFGQAHTVCHINYAKFREREKLFLYVEYDIL